MQVAEKNHKMTKTFGNFFELSQKNNKPKIQYNILKIMNSDCN